MAASVAESSSATVLAAQTALNDLSSKFNGRTPIRVHFLDNSSKMFLVEPTSLARELVVMVLEKFGVVDPDQLNTYFGLFESKDGASIGDMVNLEENIVDLVKKWPADPSTSAAAASASASPSSKDAADGAVASSAKLVFMVRLFMPCLWGLQYRDRVAVSLKVSEESLSLDQYIENAEMRDEALLHLQYLQAVYHVITGQYPTTEEQALMLGALHFIFKFGEYRPSSHKVGFLGLRIVEFIPIKHLRSKEFEEWEKALLDTLKEQSQLGSGGSPQRRYMETIYRMPIYGCSFFRTAQRGAKNMPPNVIVGVHFQGIKIFDKQRALLKTFKIEEVFRWGFKPNVLFYFEVKPTDELAGTLEFDTEEGQKISDLLTDYALAFLQEKDREETRCEGDPPLPGAPSALANYGTIPAGAKVSPRDLVKQKTISPDTAATRIQALFRGFALRLAWLKEDAAIVLQALFRGHLGRMRVSELIETMLAEEEEGEEEED